MSGSPSAAGRPLPPPSPKFESTRRRRPHHHTEHPPPQRHWLAFSSCSRWSHWSLPMDQIRCSCNRSHSASVMRRDEGSERSTVAGGHVGVRGFWHRQPQRRRPFNSEGIQRGQQHSRSDPSKSKFYGPCLDFRGKDLPKSKCFTPHIYL